MKLFDYISDDISNDDYLFLANCSNIEFHNYTIRYLKKIKDKSK